MKQFNEISISKKNIRTSLPKNCNDCDGNPECTKKELETGSNGTLVIIYCNECFEVLDHSARKRKVVKPKKQNEVVLNLKMKDGK